MPRGRGRRGRAGRGGRGGAATNPKPPTAPAPPVAAPPPPVSLPVAAPVLPPESVPVAAASAPEIPFFRIRAPSPTMVEDPYNISLHALTVRDLPVISSEMRRQQILNESRPPTLRLTLDDEPIDMDIGIDIDSLLGTGVAGGLAQMNLGSPTSPSSMIAEHSDEEDEGRGRDGVTLSSEDEEEKEVESGTIQVDLPSEEPELQTGTGEEQSTALAVPVPAESVEHVSDEPGVPPAAVPKKQGKGRGKGRGRFRRGRKAAAAAKALADEPSSNSGATEENAGVVVIPPKQGQVASVVSTTGLLTNTQTGATRVAPTGGASKKTNKKKVVDTADNSNRTPVEELVSSTFMYMMLMQHRKIPVKKSDIIKYALHMQARDFPRVMLLLDMVLDEVFGMKMLGIGETQKSGLFSLYILVSKYCLAVADMVTQPDPETDVHRSIIFLLLTVIFMLNRSVDEEMIWKVISVMKFHEQVCRQKENLRAFLKKEYVKTAYLSFEELNDVEPPIVRYSWGQRAEREYSKYSILKFVVKQFPGRRMSDFPTQLAIAKQEAPELVEADQRLEEELLAAAAAREAARETEDLEPDEMESPDDHVVTFNFFGSEGFPQPNPEKSDEDEELLSQPCSRRYDSSDDEDSPAPLISLIDDDEPTDTFVHEPPPPTVITASSATPALEGSSDIDTGIAELEPLDDPLDDLPSIEDMDVDEVHMPDLPGPDQDEDAEDFPIRFQQFPCFEEFPCPPTPGGAMLFSLPRRQKKEPRPSSSKRIPTSSSEESDTD